MRADTPNDPEHSRATKPGNTAVNIPTVQHTRVTQIYEYKHPTEEHGCFSVSSGLEV